MTRTMRDSGVEFLGEIPSHWSVQPAVTLARVLTSTVDKKSYEGEKSVRLCNYTDVYYSDEIVDSSNFMVATASSEQITKFSVRAGDVPFTKDSETAADIGIPAYVPMDLANTVYGYHLSIFRPIDKRRGRFLRYLLTSDYAKAYFEAKTPGVTRVGLSQPTIRYFRVPTPPLEEATAIADYLDRETAQIDAFIAKNEDLITLLTERRVAEISSVFSGVAPEVQLRRLSTVPIQNGVDAVGDPSNPTEWPRYVRTTDIASMSSLNPEKRVTIAPDIAKPGLVEKDDMLMTRAGATIGKSYLHTSGEVASYAGYLVRIRPNPGRVLPWYLAYWAQSQQYLDQIRSGAVVSTIENFSASKYRALRVPLPPIALQADIVDRIRRSVETSNRAIEMATAAIDLAWERRAALISAAVTGKIEMGVAV